MIQKQAMIVIGIECKTSNAPNEGPHDIPRHWERFFQENIAGKIPNKASDEIIALYCDYEGDFTQPYSFVIGCRSNSLMDIPEGMVAKIIPSGTYSVLPVTGEYPKSLIATWNEIWQRDIKRAYTADYEIYGEGFFQGISKGLDVILAIQETSTPLKRDEMIQKNRRKFEDIKKLNLPLGQYAITGSGPLGIRNLREMADIDIIVSAALWNVLAAKYGVINKEGVSKIAFPGNEIEVLREGSWFNEERDTAAPTIAQRIAEAEIIEELPFESLKHLMYFKREWGREKDLNDIFLIGKFHKQR